MANDRIHIRCRGCGGWKMLMSYNGQELSANTEIVEWLNLHGRCHPQSGVDLSGEPGFTLHADDEVGQKLSHDRQNAGPETTDNKKPAGELAGCI